MSLNEVKSEPKISYSFNAWQRLVTVSKALIQTETNVAKLKREIADRLEFTARIRQRKSELQTSVISSQNLEEKLKLRIAAIRAQSVRLNRAHNDVRVAESSFSELCEKCFEGEKKLTDLQASLAIIRAKLLVSLAQLMYRRREMLMDINCIYKVEEQNAPLSFCVCQIASMRIDSVHLPDAESYAGHDETSVAVALSHVAHLLCLISRIWDLPLRYQTENTGGRVIVIDHILSNLSDSDRRFPLVLKGQDRQRFQYGVFLLNKDIAQFRYYCGMPTKDLRLTLNNVKGLIEFHSNTKIDSMFLTPRSNVSAIQNSPSRISCSTSNLLSITKDSRAHSAGKEIPLMENQVVSESLLVGDMAARLETKTVFDSNRMETTLNSTVILNCQDSRYELIKDFSNGIAVKSEDGQLGAFGGIWNANTELNPFKTAAVEDPNE